MDVIRALERRRAIQNFDPTVEISNADLARLIEPVLLTPTSFNLQHYRFLVARNAEKKAQLCEASFNQQQVKDCSAVVIITAKLTAHEDAGAIYEFLPSDINEKLVKMTAGFYADHPSLQRDEALRSGSLAAMTLMLVASSLEFDTCPMIGYDPAAVAEIMNIPDDHISVMMICIGKAAQEPKARSGRYSVSDVVRLELFDGAVLESGRSD